MGIDYAAKVMVGLPRNEFTDQERLQELIDEDKIFVCPPYYDGNDADSAIAGLSFCCSPDYSPKELEWDQAKIDRLKAEFKELTGLDAKVYLSPYGS